MLCEFVCHLLLICFEHQFNRKVKEIKQKLNINTDIILKMKKMGIVVLLESNVFGEPGKFTQNLNQIMDFKSSEVHGQTIKL